jgi:hypothetical protein
MNRPQGGPPSEHRTRLDCSWPVAKLRTHSHEVKLLYDVFPFGRYRLIGSAIPLRRFAGPEVFPTLTSSTQSKSNALPSVSLLSSSESLRTCPPPTHRQQLSWGLVPFSACSNGGPVRSGLPHPTPSDFRVLHPLAGFLPPKPSSLVSCR